MSRIVILFLGLILASACNKVVEPQLTRQEIFIKNHPDLSEQTKKHILEGTVIVGMTEAEVRATWGDQKVTEIFNSGENSYKRWVYDDGKPVLYWKNGKVHKMDKE